MNVETFPSLAEAVAVLAECGLPSDDIEPHFLEHFLVARGERGPVGLAGLQLLGDTALLRSVAVIASRRLEGLGGQLVRAAEDHARDAGVNEVFLLTNDAQRFFARHGYAEISRCSAPAEVQATAQFGSTCCGAATLMRKQIG